jgi:glycosyltransferase involved in cell wall biosynthesis
LVATERTEFTDGEIVVPGTDDLGDRTRALVERIGEISPDALICHARGDPIDFNAIRYLPASIPKILILHGSTLAVYRAARAVRDHVNVTVAISPRIKEDLISSYGFHEDQLELIPHGIDITAYSNNSLSVSQSGRVRILLHGRIERNKGVLWLPEILSELGRHADEWDCTVSGDGPGLEELKKRIVRAGLSSRIQFVGWTAPEEVPELMSRHDIFLFPTKFEGYPIALIEAMAGGCVPVVSRLPGVTDWIIQDGVNGLLFPIGNVRQAARHLLGLCSDRRRLAELRHRAPETVSRYSLEWMAEQYYQLLCGVRSGPQSKQPAERLDKCELADGLKPAWWYSLPEPVKNRLRIVREKIRTSVRVP